MRWKNWHDSVIDNIVADEFALYTVDGFTGEDATAEARRRLDQFTWSIKEFIGERRTTISYDYNHYIDACIARIHSGEVSRLNAALEGET